MVSFTALTAATLAGLPERHPIFYRGPDGEASVEHYVLDGPSRKFGRTVTLRASDAEAWQFDPAAIKIGDTIHSPKRSPYTVSACEGEGDSLEVTADFVGDLTDDKLPCFSTESKAT